MRNESSPQVRVANTHHDDLSNVMHGNQAVLSTDVASVLKNTYMLLGMTLAFSAFTAFFIGAYIVSALMHTVMFIVADISF